MRHPRLPWHLLLFIAFTLCIEFSFVASNTLFAQEVQTKPEDKQAGEPDQDNTDSDVHIPPQSECMAKTGDWSEPERWAWTQICSREPIDFDKRYGVSRDGENLDRLATDPRRRIGAVFLRQIFEDPRLSIFTQNTSIDITGAYLPAIQIGSTTIGSLTIIGSKVGGNIDLDRVTILRNISLRESDAGDVTLRSVEGGDFELINVIWAI
jgi:hypothetical protein